MKTTLLKVYRENGLRGLISYMNKNNIPYSRQNIEFGLDSNNNSLRDKVEFLENSNEKEIHLHYYSVSKKGKNGYIYNLLRGVKITLK